MVIKIICAQVCISHISTGDWIVFEILIDFPNLGFTIAKVCYKINCHDDHYCQCQRKFPFSHISLLTKFTISDQKVLGLPLIYQEQFQNHDVHMAQQAFRSARVSFTHRSFQGFFLKWYVLMMLILDLHALYGHRLVHKGISSQWRRSATFPPCDWTDSHDPGHMRHQAMRKSTIWQSYGWGMHTYWVTSH